MTYPMNYPKQVSPAYSGITINITNPTLNAAPLEAKYSHNCTPQCVHHQPTFAVGGTVAEMGNVSPNALQYGNSNPNSNLVSYPEANSTVNNPYNFANNSGSYDPNMPGNPVANNVYGVKDLNSGYNPSMATAGSQGNQSLPLISTVSTPNYPNVQGVNPNSQNQQMPVVNGQASTQNAQPVMPQQAYPPQYYLNNYNYIQNGERGGQQTVGPERIGVSNPAQPNTQVPLNSAQFQADEDMSSSQGIIENLDARVAEQKDLEKNGKKTRVIALTNEYIMSLENYLNNPNSEIRLMASKEVLKRLDEDKDRFDDAALNALLNKMLQDPNKLIRIAAMSAFGSQLASGNNYTITLLRNIQANPNSDKEDVLQAADILLKMSSTTEVKYVPVKKQEKSNGNKELEATQKQNEQLRAQLQKYKEKEIEKMLQVPQGK